MELYLKITVCLLLLVQASHLVLLQHTTDSPGKTIDKGWLRELVKNNAGIQNAPGPQDETDEYQGSDGTAMESSGIASGSMAISNEEEENLANQDKNATSGSDDLTVAPLTEPPAIQNKQPELLDSSQSNMTNAEEESDNSKLPQNSTTNLEDAKEDLHNSQITLQNSTTNLEDAKEDLQNSQITLQNSTTNVEDAKEDLHNSQIALQNSTTNLEDAKEDLQNSTTNLEDTKEDLQNSTTNLSAQNSSSIPDDSTHTDLQGTALAPEGNDTKEDKAKPEEEDTSLTNATDSTNTDKTEESSDAAVPEKKAPTFPPTTVFLLRTKEMSPSEKANKTKQGSATGDSSERGLETDPHTSKRQGAWGAVLGTMVAVACVGLVAYIILKKKHQKAFSHRKLVEEFPSDPVLRLDNSGPMDFGGSAYYNPGLQGDNIQMNNFPGRR